MSKIVAGLPAVLLCCILLWTGTTQAASSSKEHSALLLKDAAGTVLFSCPVQDGMTFGLRYIHSVAKTPVEEWFCISNQTIFLEKTIYQDFGAGLPHNPEPGQTMTTGNGHIVISGYHRALHSFDVRVGRIAQHTLLLPLENTAEKHPAHAQVREISLASLAPPGSAVTFTLGPVHPHKSSAPIRKTKDSAP